MLAANLARVGGHQPFAVRLPADRCHGRIAINLGPALARPLGQRLAEVGRLDVTVGAMLDRAEDPVGVAQRPGLGELLGGQEIDVHADRLRDPGVIMIFVHPVTRAGKADV